MVTTIWFTADTHFHHKNILHLGRGRPWDTVEEMNDALVHNWNQQVLPHDHVYHLGDISFGGREATLETMRRLHGNIHIIKGNHDQPKMLSYLSAEMPNVTEIRNYLEIKVDGQKIVLFHFPILDWHGLHKGSWHLHGHCHANLQFDNGPMLDVGMDNMSYTPIDFESVRALLKDVPPKFHTHHDATPKEVSGG